MVQVKCSIDESTADFLNRHKQYGFKDRSAMVKHAIEFFRHQVEIEDLTQSADIYSEVYGRDQELQEITQSAIFGWPK
jgi:hypothetical protein